MNQEPIVQSKDIAEVKDTVTIERQDNINNIDQAPSPTPSVNQDEDSTY